MSSRDVLRNAIRLSPAVALLLLPVVMSSPIRPPSPARRSIDRLSRNFAIPPAHPAHLSEVSADFAPGRVTCLYSDTEEEMSEAGESASPILNLSPSDSRSPLFASRQLSSSIAMLAPRPLRC